MSRRLFRTTFDGQSPTVEVDGNRARIGGNGGNGDDAAAAATFSVEPLDAPSSTSPTSSSGVTAVRVREDNSPNSPGSRDTAVAHHVYTAIENGIVWTFIDGEVFRIEVEDAERATRARASAGDEALAAPMPATVIKLLVEPGAIVERGDALLLLEAMKMELPIRAPHAGQVTAFHCKAGDLVQPGVPLVVLHTT